MCQQAPPTYRTGGLALSYKFAMSQLHLFDLADPEDSATQLGPWPRACWLNNNTNCYATDPRRTGTTGLCYWCTNPFTTWEETQCDVPSTSANPTASSNAASA